jgi:hypothetical protein
MRSGGADFWALPVDALVGFYVAVRGLSCATSKLTLQGSLRVDGINFRSSSTAFRGVEG